MATRRAPDPDASCPVTRGEVDLDAYAAVDAHWQALGLGAPARRALVNAGLLSLADLRTVTKAELAALHGLGPSTLRLLAPAMAAAAITFQPPTKKRPTK